MSSSPQHVLVICLLLDAAVVDVGRCREVMGEKKAFRLSPRDETFPIQRFYPLVHCDTVVYFICRYSQMIRRPRYVRNSGLYVILVQLYSDFLHLAMILIEFFIIYSSPRVCNDFFLFPLDHKEPEPRQNAILAIFQEGHPMCTIIFLQIFFSLTSSVSSIFHWQQF